MTKITTSFIFRSIAVIIAELFCFTTLCYGMDLSKKHAEDYSYMLRLPMASNHSQERVTNVREALIVQKTDNVIGSNHDTDSNVDIFDCCARSFPRMFLILLGMI